MRPDLAPPLGAALLLVAVHLALAAVDLGVPRPDGADTAFRQLLAATSGWAPAALPRLAAAPWVHGDRVHLFSNLAGLALLGPGVVRVLGALGGWAALTAGCLAGVVLAAATGAESLGTSGGIFALAGVLVSAGPGRYERSLGGGWLALGLLGGVGDPQVDGGAHLLGALLGLGLGTGAGRERFRPNRAVAAMMALWWGAGLAWVASRAEACAARVRAHGAELGALATAGRALRAQVAWAASRRGAVDAYLEASRTGRPGTDLAVGLVASLGPPGDLAPAPEARGSGDAGIASRVSRLHPGDPPPGFDDPGALPPMERSREADWRALLAFLDTEDRRLAGAGEELLDWSRDLRRRMAVSRAPP